MAEKFDDLLAAGEKFIREGKPELARAEFLQALAYAKTDEGELSDAYDHALLRLAEFHHEQYENGDEYTCLAQRADLRRQRHGAVPATASALHDLGLWHFRADEFPQCEALAREGISFCVEPSRELLAPNAAPTGTAQDDLSALIQCYRMLSRCCYDTEQYTACIVAGEKVLSLCAIAGATFHANAAWSSVWLACAYYHEANHAAALELLELCLPMLSNRYRLADTTIARGHHVLGLCYRKFQRHADAARVLDIACEYVRTGSRFDKRYLAEILESAAEAHLSLGASERCERKLRESIRFCKASSDGAPSEQACVAQSALIDFLIQSKRYGDAEPVLETVLADLEQLHGKDALILERTLNNLGYTQVHLEEFPKAEQTLRRANTLYLQHNGRSGPYIIKNLGLMYQQMGYNAEAITHFQEARVLFVNEYGTEHPMLTFIDAALTKLNHAL